MTNSLPTGSPRLLRRMNAAAVLAAIRGAEGPVSRTELARATGLSKPTVNEVVELLLRAQYVSESLADGETRPRRPGPRARLLRFRGNLGHVLGIDIGANKVLVTLADLNGRLVAVERRRTTALQRRSAPALLDAVRAAARRALESGGAAQGTLKAVGVGTPGVVDPQGRVTLAPQLGGWEGLQLGKLLGRSFPCPVLVENEVSLSMLAERWRGAARAIDDAFFVQLGVGIGGGILTGGEVYRGSGGAAGEIGYLPFFDDSGQEREGAGPFEHAAGGAAFARLGRRAAAAGDGAMLLELAGGDPEAIDAETVFEAAGRGDPAAAAIVAELLERIARGIAAAVVVLNPSTVIVGGGLSRAGTSLLDPLAARVAELVPMSPRVVLSTLGDEAVALGAVRLALQSVEESLFEELRMEAV